MQIPDQSLWLWAQSPHSPQNVLDEVLVRARGMLGAKYTYQAERVLNCLFANPTAEDAHRRAILDIYQGLNVNTTVYAWRSYMHLDRHILSAMSAHPTHSIRLEAAHHPLTDTQDLNILARDKRAGVRAAVAGQTRTDINVLEALSQDPKSSVRATAKQTLQFVPPELRP